MDQEDTKLVVQGLWLQYSGLKAGSARKYDWIENVARAPLIQPLSEEIPEITGLMVAT